MCAGALINARVRTLVFGASDPKAGAASSLYNVCSDPRLNHNPEVIHGVLFREPILLMRKFFEHRRETS